MKSTIQKAQQGFTLIELMIVVAIIGILASVAMPSYQNYTKKAKFTEVVMAATSYKLAVEMCINTLGAETNCAAGTNGIPAAITSTNASGSVKTLSVAAGVITVTSNIAGNKTSDGTSVADVDYVITPTMKTDGRVNWAITGSCTTTGLC